MFEKNVNFVKKIENLKKVKTNVLVIMKDL